MPVAYLVDEHKFARPKATVGIAVLIFLAGLPAMLGNGYIDFFTHFITYIGAEEAINFIGFSSQVADLLLLFGGFLIVLFAAYVWKRENLNAELAQGFAGFGGSFAKAYINFAVKYLCPVLLGVFVRLGRAE